MRFKPYNLKEDVEAARKPSIFKAVNGKCFYSEWWCRVSDRVKDLCERGGRISKEEYLSMRGNSYDWKTITPILSNKALIEKTENSLKNIFRGKSRYECDTTYDDALVSTLVPVLLDRIEEFSEKVRELEQELLEAKLQIQESEDGRV